MKLHFLTCVLVFLSFYSFAQEKKLKQKKIKTFFSNEIFTVEKKTKIRNGSYIKLGNETGDTLATGQYRDGLRVGLWEFKGYSNEPYLKYNYDSREIEQITNVVDSFPIRRDSIFVVEKVDNPPLYLDFKGQIDVSLAQTKPPVEISRYGVFGTSLASFVIGKDGNMKDIEIVKSLRKSMDGCVIESIKSLTGEWIPARKNGQNVDSKMFVLYVVSDSPKPTINFERPYCRTIIIYFKKFVVIN